MIGTGRTATAIRRRCSDPDRSRALSACLIVLPPAVEPRAGRATGGMCGRLLTRKFGPIRSAGNQAGEPP